MLFVFNGSSFLDWLTVDFLSFVLEFTFMFSKGASIHNFLFTSNSEADVPELFFIVRSANMAKYGSLSSSLHFHSVFLMVWIALSTNHYSEGTLEWKSCVWNPMIWKILKLIWTILGSIVTKSYFGYAMLYKYTSCMGNDCIWWGIW